MAPTRLETVKFKRSRFIAHLPKDYLYSPAHFWLHEAEPGLWRVGLTTFATRMLGEIVEFDLETATGSTVKTGEVVGWIEGFKATSDLFCVVDGTLQGANPEALEDAEKVCNDPFRSGWLYAVRGTPDPQATDIDGYLQLLGETIDTMEEKPWQGQEMGTT